MSIRNIELAIMRAIPQDKCLHLIAGAIVFAVVHPLGVGLALAIVLAVGVGKEVLDHFTGGDVSIWDVFATCCGGTLGFLCALPMKV